MIYFSKSEIYLYFAFFRSLFGVKSLSWIKAFHLNLFF